MKAYLAEFIGTGVLVLLGDGVVATASSRCSAPRPRSVTAGELRDGGDREFMLVFGILGIAANANAISNGGEAVDLATLFSTGLGPLLVGLLVLVIGASLGGPTGYAINPARDSRRAWPTRCSRSRASAIRTGATPGCRWSGRSWAGSSAPWSGTS